jgi:aspartate/methionine/tyrosine aminotransferase
MPALANRLKDIEMAASAVMTMKARELAAKGIKVISLAVGEPDFDTPRHAIDAAYQAALSGDTKYPPQDGTKALKEAVQRKFKRDNNLDYALDEIMVSNGGKQVIMNALLGTCDPGDEVLIPAPYWISYSEMAKLATGEARHGQLPAEQRLQAAAGGPRGGDHAEDQVADPELPQQPDRRGVFPRRDEGARRGAAAPPACLGHDRRHVRAPRL